MSYELGRIQVYKIEQVMNEKIELLAREKDFASLNLSERALVLAVMPQEEFEQLRMVLLAVRQMDAELLPPAHVKARLLERMSAKPRVPLRRRVLSMQIPVWQAAAAVLIGTAVVWLLKKESVQERYLTEIQIQRDTVWQEKIVWRERRVWRDRVVFKEKPSYEPIAISPEPLSHPEQNPELFQPEFAV